MKNPILDELYKKPSFLLSKQLFETEDLRFCLCTHQPLFSVLLLLTEDFHRESKQKVLVKRLRCRTVPLMWNWKADPLLS